MRVFLFLPIDLSGLFPVQIEYQIEKDLGWFYRRDFLIQSKDWLLVRGLGL